jgi:hypothetical protein
MFLDRDPVLLGMAGLRFLSGSIEMTAALLMLYDGTISRAIAINAGLSLVGPLVLIVVTTLGLVGAAGELPLAKMALIVAGVACILWGALS